MTIAAICVAIALLQTICLHLHLRGRPPVPRALPPISVLKPLCGVDDGLEENLRSFAALDYPDYEVLLGVRDPDDAAYAVARATAARWPDRFRVVLQRGAPGLNPKVNQLITLEGAAKHEIVVVSDSNVRVESSYLREIAGHVEDPAVGLVTHLVSGVGERTLGAAIDNLQLACGAAAGVAATKRLAGRDIVVGKSMAMRKTDLRALGGFARLKDVLAEDFLTGMLVRHELHKRVALGSTPIANVNTDECLARCFGRYLRWSVMQRHAVGNTAYAAQIFLHPILFAPFAGRYAPLVLLARMCIDALALGALRKSFWLAAISPAKDAVAAAAWIGGLFTDEICWRGNLLRVLPGTALVPVEREDAVPAKAA